MAIVATAPAPIDTPAGVVPPSVQPVAGAWPSAFSWLAWTATALVALGLVVDSATRFAEPGGSAEQLGQLLRLVSALAVLGVAIGAWALRRDDGELLLAATLAPVLAAVRLVATAVFQSLELATLAELADLGLGLLTLAALVWTLAAAATPRPNRLVHSAAQGLFERVALVTAVLLFGVGLSGVAVRAVGASWACQGTFPDCNGQGILPFGREPLADVQLYHRLLAYVGLGLIVWLAIEARRTQPPLWRPTMLLLGTALAQGAFGVAAVASPNPTLTQALHTAGAVGTVACAVAVVVLARRVVPAGLGAPGQAATRAAPALERESAALRLAAAYVQLTKPRVMSLLLATTAAAMIIAARGMPDLGIFVATLLGGALMSGGAGAINHYVDRDIDPLMGRTAWRPIPAGLISPRHALAFGIVLGVLATTIFIVWVNVLAAVLALIGLLGYVFVYTLWLKRSTPSNIVIGGAAGAIPPLVGWAAVTNELHSLTAWYLFAIIFFWTPPHFWALSLLIQQHYARARVPMLPVVRGEAETRWQILLYAVLLVALTLVLSPFGMMGWFYFAAAAILGALFLRGAVLLWRRHTVQAARGLYLYSLLYLFALFAAMAIDRVLG